MTGLSGTAELIRFIVRRDRIRILVWVVATAALVALTAAAVKGLYPTQTDLAEAAAAATGNPAVIAFNGPVQGLDTVGGEVAFQAGAMGLVVIALMSILMTGRLTRGEEEAGRLELLRSLPVGSLAPSSSALVVVATMNVAVGMLVTLSLLGEQLPVEGSVIFGMSFTLVGLLFVCVTLLAAQVTENTRVVYAISGSVLGTAFIVRAVGDIGDGTVSWFSPIGWAQKARPFADEQWWPFLLMLAAIAGLIAISVALEIRRDLGGGLVSTRPGPATAAPSLGHPLGLAVRLQRGSVLGWSIGILIAGVGFGSIAPSIDDFAGSSTAIADFIAQAGGVTLTDSYLATCYRLLALAGTGYAVQSVFRLRSEEASFRAESVLATPVSRWRWSASYLAVAFGGSVIILLTSGLAVGISYAVVGGDLNVIPQQVESALAYTPAMWVMIAFTFALFGLAPRWIGAAWAFLAMAFAIGLLGELLAFPRWVSDISPFEHVPQLPAADLQISPLVALVVIAVGLTAAGAIGIRKRDISG